MSANETWAKLIGVILVIVGVVGFFTGDMLLGFGINTLHNLVHLVTGAIWAWAGFAAGPARDVNKWLGVIYILVALLGFLGYLGFLNVNVADNWLHVAIGVISAWVGFGAK